MSKERFALRMLVCACSVTYMGYAVAHVHATQTEIRDDVSVVRATKDSGSPTEQNQAGPSLRANKPVVLTVSARQSQSRQRQIKRAGSDSKQKGTYEQEEDTESPDGAPKGAHPSRHDRRPPAL